jgi:hypothetical protein
VVADEIEGSDAVIIASDSFAIDHAGARTQAGQRLDDPRKAVGEVIAGPAVEPHSRSLLPGDHPKSVMLDFVQP